MQRKVNLEPKGGRRADAPHTELAGRHGKDSRGGIRRPTGDAPGLRRQTFRGLTFRSNAPDPKPRDCMTPPGGGRDFRGTDFMKRSIPFLLLAVVVALVGVSLLVVGHRATSPANPFGRIPAKPRIPAKLSVRDFQRSLDDELMAWLREMEGGSLVQALDVHLVKPLVDDVNTRSVALAGLEVSATQFPTLHAIVVDCAAVLHMDTIPRVFITQKGRQMVGTENYSEPIILIHPYVVRRFRDPVEFRFLIGRELGHVKARHVRWQSVLHNLRAGLAHADASGWGAAQLPLLPLLRWSRESEMTADNAGVICAQDGGVSEQVLVRLFTGVDGLGAENIDVDSYLAQTRTSELSRFSEVASLWAEANRPVPFLPERIRQMREFSRSSRYKNLWK